MSRLCTLSFFFFFFQAEDGIRDVAVTGVQTCALPISRQGRAQPAGCSRLSLRPACSEQGAQAQRNKAASSQTQDRKSTRLNSSHGYISYAVFCLKKKNKLKNTQKTNCSREINRR